MTAIETEHLEKYYGKARGISDVTLHVEAGEFYGFIGPNGAGKSTTIRILLGLIRASSGKCRIFDMDCWTQRERILRRIGYVPSENAFYPGMKVKDVLNLSAKLRNADCDKEAGRLCDIFQLDVEKKTSELSYGNRKKLSVICALQHRPDLLIFDEPTGGLDPLMQKAFFDILDERNREGTTVFLSSHVLSEVQRHCSRIAVIRSGRVIACDSVESLQQKSIRKVSLTGSAALDRLEGVKDLTVTPDGCSCFYNGPVQKLLQVLADGNVSDFTVQEPDLEEIFLHYYEEE